MMIKTVRSPGQKGTRKLLKKYGDRLVCVRYRYDHENKRRLKTVELIIAEEDWVPPEKPAEPVKEQHYETTPYVGVRIMYSETSLRESLKAIGAHWSPGERLWYAPEEYVRRIGLMDRVVKRD